VNVISFSILVLLLPFINSFKVFITTSNENDVFFITCRSRCWILSWGVCWRFRWCSSFFTFRTFYDNNNIVVRPHIVTGSSKFLPVSSIRGHCVTLSPCNGIIRLMIITLNQPCSTKETTLNPIKGPTSFTILPLITTIAIRYHSEQSRNFTTIHDNTLTHSGRI